MNTKKDRFSPRYIANIGTLAIPNPNWIGDEPEPIKLFEHLWIELEDDKVLQIGPENEPFPDQFSESEIFDAQGMLVTPGLIDPHTHPVFADFRQGEFVRRCQGETYRQIAAAGGGIKSTVRGVREASEEHLTELVYRRLERFLRNGVTSIEAKSGYGLSCESELKSLRAIKAAAKKHPLDVSPTLLAAHVVPPEFLDNPEDYVDLICDSIIPKAVEEGLTEAVDVFLEDSAFNEAQTVRIFKAADRAGLRCRLHADQFSCGSGAEIAAEFNAITADHMDYTGTAGIELLAKNDVTVVLLPGAVFFLGLDRYAAAREMLDQGCRIALSTDFNPGSSPTQSLALMMSLGCIKMGLTPKEALWAATMGGAFAIDRQEKVGTLLPGYKADICVWEAENVEFLPYAYGNILPSVVFKDGKICYLSSSNVV